MFACTWIGRKLSTIGSPSESSRLRNLSTTLLKSILIKTNQSQISQISHGITFPVASPRWCLLQESLSKELLRCTVALSGFPSHDKSFDADVFAMLMHLHITISVYWYVSILVYENENHLIVEIVSGVCLQKVGKGYIWFHALTGLKFKKKVFNM